MDQFTLEICKKYWTREGCRERLCQRLHLCRFYLTYRCEGRKKTGKRCIFSHSLKDEHNVVVLEHAGRVNMTIHELKAAYREQTNEVKSFRAKRNIPEVCKFYNGIKGGCKHNNTWNSRCPCLHICRHYALGDCKFGNRCKYSHKINDPQPQALLISYSINVFPYNEQEVLDEIKDRMLEVEDHELSVNVRSEGKKLIQREIINNDANFSRNEPGPYFAEHFNYNSPTVPSSSQNPFYKNDPFTPPPFSRSRVPQPAFSGPPKNDPFTTPPFSRTRVPPPAFSAPPKNDPFTTTPFSMNRMPPPAFSAPPNKVLPPEVIRFLQNIPQAFENMHVGRNEVKDMNTERNQHYTGSYNGYRRNNMNDGTNELFTYDGQHRNNMNRGTNQRYVSDGHHRKRGSHDDYGVSNEYAAVKYDVQDQDQRYVSDGHHRKRGSRDDYRFSNGYAEIKYDVHSQDCLFEHSKRLRFSLNF